MRTDGLYYERQRRNDESDDTDQAKESKASWIRLCGPFEVRARTLDTKFGEWGKLIYLRDYDGELRRVLISDATLDSERGDWCAQLRKNGLWVSVSREHKQLLRKYLNSISPHNRAKLVHRIGWHEGRYLTPAWCVPESDSELIVFQDSGALEHHFGEAGSLESWRREVSLMAVGNPLQAFALSCAFAAPLLPLKPGMGGGFHFASMSSSGKSTTLVVAGSVWGGGGKDGFVQGWDATPNGLEALAASRNHCLLLLDELKQLPSDQAGAIVYKLANGQARARMNKDIQGRAREQWELIYLSTGEFGFLEYIKAREKRAYAGQEVRLCEIPADSGKYKSFENLHGRVKPEDFADEINHSARNNYGTAGRAFVEKVAAVGFRAVGPRLASLIQDFSARCREAGTDPAVDRILKRFAFVAAAGELATEWGITGWQNRESTLAAEHCFRLFLGRRGGLGSLDKRQAMEHVRQYLLANINRFVDHSEGRTNRNGPPHLDIAGYREQRAGKTELQFPRGALPKEMVEPFGRDLVMQVLKDEGALLKEPEAGKEKNPKRTLPIGSGSRPRCTVVLLEKLLEDEDSASEEANFGGHEGQTVATVDSQLAEETGWGASGGGHEGHQVDFDAAKEGQRGQTTK